MDVDRRLDELFIEYDAMLRAGRMEEIDRDLQAVNVQDTHIDILIGYLTILHVAQDCLPYYARFFGSVKEELMARAQYTDDLLSGLEPV